MTTRFRRPMLVLGTTILIMQAVFMPVGMVYAETTMDTEEQELMELPPMKNYLEEEQISDPRFFFTRSRMQGTAEESLQVTFFSDQEVSEARVFLPEEATLLKDQLPTGISVEKGAQPNEWIVQSERAQNTFVLPLVVEQVGNYELSVEETTAHLEISEKEETIDEVPVEETESSDEDEAGQEELKEENGIDEEQENEQPAEEVREPVSDAPQEQQTNEEETDEASQVVEPTVFDGETAEVATMAEFREAVGNPDIGIISVQTNLTEATANVLTVDRPLLIQGNGYTLTFGINGFYFQLEEVTQASTIRLENVTLTKVGATPLINATVESSKNWTVELEDITEVNANTMRLASLPEGSIHFTGGVSNFTRTTSAQTFIEAKEVLATNQAEVTISRGNATVFFSSATVLNPKLTVEQGAAVTITTTAGVANTIDLRGEKPEVFLQNGELDVATVGTTAAPTDTTNNTISLTGTTPKITMNSGARMTVISTLAKRGIHLAGDNAQLLINNSEISVTSATQAAINISGDHSSFSSENSTIQLGSTTGITMNMTGESPQLIFDSSVVNVTSTTGQRINLIGASPLVSLASTEMIMNASTGRGIYLQGATPQVIMENSQLLMTDTGASQGMILQGTDALLSLSNQSELSITGAGTGALENIQIGNNNARPELSVIGESKVSVTTTSGTGAATDTTNNAIHLRGADPKATVTERSELEVSITSGARRGLYLNGDNPELTVTDSQLSTTTVLGFGVHLTGIFLKFTITEATVKITTTRSGTGIYLNGSDAEWTVNESQINVTTNSSNDQLTSRAYAILIEGGNAKIRMEGHQTTVYLWSNGEVGNGYIDAVSTVRIVGNDSSSFDVNNGAVINIFGTGISNPVFFSRTSLSVRNNSQFNASLSNGSTNAYVYFVNGSGDLNIDGGLVNLEKSGANGWAAVHFASNSKVNIENSGQLNIYNEGSGAPSDGNIINSSVNLNNLALHTGVDVEINITDPKSKLKIVADLGPAVHSTVRSTINVNNQGELEMIGRTASSNGATIYDINLEIDNPFYVDIRNNRPGGGRIHSHGSGSRSLTLNVINSDLSLWTKGSNLTGIPQRTWDPFNFRVVGGSWNTIEESSNPEFNHNAGSFGSSGMSAYARMSLSGGGDNGINLPISPVDPLDPEKEVDPENKPELPEYQGTLSIDFVSAFHFGSQTISAQAQTYYAQPQRLLNEDGSVDEEEERPNYVQISDRRPENERNGWQLAVTQSKQFETTAGHQLSGASIRFTNQQLTTAQGGKEPELQQTNPLILVPGQRRLLMVAQGEEGTGTWVYRFGDRETAGESVTLSVPKGTNPEATTYATTLVWELSAVPSN